MSAKIQKLEQILNNLIANSEADGCALVNDKGQIMVAQLRQGVDQKAISAMATALMSIGIRVGEALEAGAPRTIVIEGKDKTIILMSIGTNSLIATAPANARIGLVDFEMTKAAQEITGVL
ncbi:MAG: roadblock/LC7 domain-containing protein [Candidatus Thorarchaeota archaeon]